MSQFGFCGGSYRVSSPTQDCESTWNMYLEPVESGQGKSNASLLDRPGLKLFTQIDAVGGGIVTSTRGLFTFNSRSFYAAGPQFGELASGGGTVFQNSIQSDNLPASFAAGPGQLLFTSAGMMYVFDLNANTLAPVDPTTYQGPISTVGYVDGFFIALTANSGRFAVSAPDDATSWDQSNVAIVSVFGDNVVSMGIGYRQILFNGAKNSVWYYDSGNLFPFDVVQGSYMEVGAASVYGIAEVDFTLYWMGADARGTCQAWKANTYSNQRISDFGTENIWSGYATVADVRAFSFQEKGHIFFVLYFPTANATWVYDAATGEWFEWGFWNPATNSFIAYRAQCHTFNPALNKHLVGDWNGGFIYEQSTKFSTDFGNLIRRRRIAPVIAKENQRIRHDQFDLDCEVGLGPQPPLVDLSGQPRGPIAWLSWTENGGKTWSDPLPRDLGKAGEYEKRVHWNRLGVSRHRNYMIEYVDPVPFRVNNAYLFAEPGFEAQERYPKQITKVA
jgi:hypothetical protein